MNRHTSSVMKGITMGMIAGTATYMACSASKSRSKMLKKNACKAVSAVGSMIDNVTHFMK